MYSLGGQREKSLVEEGIRKSKELGGSAKRCHVTRKVYYEIEGCTEDAAKSNDSDRVERQVSLILRRFGPATSIGSWEA
jgi:hypothetical protein